MTANDCTPTLKKIEWMPDISSAIQTLQSYLIFWKKVGETFENRNGNFVSLHRQNERRKMLSRESVNFLPWERKKDPIRMGP